MNIAIVDDEKVIREQIKDMVVKQKPDCIVDTYENGESLLGAGRHYAVVFLDIQMEGQNGIDIARVLREQQEDIAIIFITGIKEYVFEAFDVGAFHYLLKPVEEKKLTEVFERAVREAEKRYSLNQKLIFIKTKNHSYTINRESVMYIESRGKKVEVHTTKEVINIYAVMSELERELEGSFYRCHRGYLVNMAHIAEYDSSSISLGNGELVYLAKERYGDFVKSYMRYLRNGGTACV